MIMSMYANDIVYRFDKHKKILFGVIIDSYEGTSEVDDHNALQKGQIRVLWNNSSREQVWRQRNVRLINRGIMPGDIVRRMEKGKETQRGYCKETKQIATVQIVGTDKVIEHVAGNRLHKVRPFDVDDAVCLGNKFGRIESVEQSVTMQSKCGSIVQFLTSINTECDDYWLAKRNRVSFLHSFYPGQEVICTPNNLEQPDWIKKSKTMKRNINSRQRFTVQNVEDVQVEVSWYNNAFGYTNFTDIAQPDVKKLKFLEHPSDTCLELAERRLLKISAHDLLLKKKDWIRKLSLAYRPDVPKVRHIVNCNSKIMSRVPKIRSSPIIYPVGTEDVGGEEEEEWWTEEAEESDDNGSSSSQNTPLTKSRKRHYPPKLGDLDPGNTQPVEILCVESKVTVVWQDGTEEKDIPSTQLYYSISLDDHEFFPGEWVDNAANKGEASKHGVVQSVNYMERTATVKWFSKKPSEFVVSESSVYDLTKHSKYVFRPGSIVKAKPAVDEKMGKVIDSCIEGYVKVQWLDGTEENCWPQDIELIPDTSDYEFSEDESSDEEAADGGASWETESIESYAGDLTDETVLQTMAARLDFVRNRIAYLKEAFRQHPITENFSFLKDLLLVYENSGYLDKLLGTSFFSLRSRHFQALLMQAKEKAKSQGVELRGRLFSSDNLCPSISKIKVAEKENINKMIRLENKINAQIEKKEGGKETEVPTTPMTPDSVSEITYVSQDNLCVELLAMLKIRMDLAYAEIISRIGGTQALSVLTKAQESVPVLTPLASTPMAVFKTPLTTPDPMAVGKEFKHKGDTVTAVTEEKGEEVFMTLEEAPVTHHYYTNKFQPADLQKFVKAVQREHKLLKESMPPGVWVRLYGNRIDLLSVLIRGPAKTPYEDGLFLFDMQLSTDYPRSPPVVHYVSYSSERLNPNLYVEGRVCVSLLGTWLGRGSEVWGPNSTLLQLIVSIQGLILVNEPYYNEAGYEKQTETQQGYENSRTYNELVILKLVQSMKEMLLSPPDVFTNVVLQHFKQNGRAICERLHRYCSDEDPLIPEFPLRPVSKGLKLSLTAALNSFQEVLSKISDKSEVNKGKA